MKVEKKPNAARLTIPGRLLLIIFGLTFPFIALEIGVRVIGLAPPAEPNPAIWTPHPLFGWWHVPNSGGIFHSDYNEFEAEVRINARGLRDREIGYDKPPETVRILSLADSFGEALQVNLEETYHKQLETQLTQTLDKPAEVINAGVGGWGTDQEAIFYLGEGFRYQPDIVLLAFFVRNDVVNNYAPLEIERNGGSQQKAFFQLSATGALIPPELDTEAKADNEGRIPEPQNAPVNGSGLTAGGSPPLLGLADTLWRCSALYRFTVPYLRDIPPVVQSVGPSGILGGEAIVRASHPTTPIPFFVYQEPPSEQIAAAWDLTEAIIGRLNEEVSNRGAQLVVVIIGAPEQVSPAAWAQIVAANPTLKDLTWDLEAPNRRITAFLARENIPHLDLLPIFRERAGQATSPALHFQHDQHWTVEGHRLAAQSINDFLVNEKLLGY